MIEQSRDPMLVPPDEMARLAGISRPHLDRLRAAGKIPSILVGRARRYEPSKVIEALAAGGADHE
ncbi:hypothetical protein RSSM_06004 [Rhodopirellula sallentina SM41]|uniref:Helix-turn-helix domain-containing protein n=2 Tax=Rhodopirellula TaxID=265488 RepID=M5U3X7_9BACT|nr:hypothetical protein RSSM_06004 [Rhodopirellula sallentina SM41]